MAPERGLLFDTFYGVAYPLDRLELSEEEEAHMRMHVAQFCLSQIGK